MNLLYSIILTVGEYSGIASKDVVDQEITDEGSSPFVVEAGTDTELDTITFQ